MTIQRQGFEQTEEEFGLPLDLSTQSNGNSQDSSVDLQKELAAIQAMRQAPSGGLGKTIGGTVGTVAGAVVVPGPLGAAVGGAVGGTVGSVVDYMIDSEAAKKAEQKRVDALRIEKMRQVQKQTSEEWLDRMARQRNMAISEFGNKMDRYSLAREMRAQFIQQLFGKIAQTQARKQNANQNFIQGRRLV